MAVWRHIALLIAAMLLSSCASALSGTRKHVRVTSRPPGALVRIDGATRGITPTVVHPSPRNDHEISVELAGYAPYVVRLDRRHNPWIAGNIATGLVPGMAFDAATGALYDFRAKSIHAELEPLRDGSPALPRTRPRVRPE